MDVHVLHPKCYHCIEDTDAMKHLLVICESTFNKSVKNTNRKIYEAE